MNLLTRRAKADLEKLVEQLQLKGARVSHKVNARGELVLAVIIPPAYPGEWSSETSSRDEKRQRRGER